MPIKNQQDTPHLESETPAVPRRLPLQSRSHRTIQRVLDAASSLLEQAPLDDVTTTRVAAEAGVSVGALYRFFPDKQAIIDAIAVRHVEQFRASLVGTVLKAVAGKFAHLELPRPAVIFDAIIDAYIAYLDAHPDFRALSFGRHISAATRERQVSPDAGVTALLKRFMLEQLGAADTAELDLKLRIVSEAGERLIAYAYEQPAREDRDRVIAEMKKMLASYLFPAQE
jgi:AcrR family transcriptional regulator